ncbi:hypothetical protein [Pedobacter sp. MC2016-24]|uniref:hypothetical protein n=1 Tax=Pedobacter sp. MC2016-24 TaxID=2780090 RepID=UPI00187F2B4C|nr:hypothetical protein [Pedobacter sp. MC2016-24]MBE9602389.1 hypothetical protein [Pedobacter sp. MC2016-24]
MIFYVKKAAYPATEKWTEGMLIDLVAENGNHICLSAAMTDAAFRIEWPQQSRYLTCLKKDLSYFELPEQLVLKVRSSTGNNGMNAEPIVLELPADFDVAQLIKALKVLTLH